MPAEPAGAGALLEERVADIAGRVARPGPAEARGAQLLHREQATSCRRCGGSVERYQLAGVPHLYCATCNSIGPNVPRPRPAEGYEPARRRDLDE